MKKLISVTLILAMLLAGCGRKAPAETTASTPASTAVSTTADTTVATTPIPPRDPAYDVGEIRIGDVSLTEYKVVLPSDADTNTVFASDELIKYIALATGKTLEKAESADKAIYVGCHPDEALGEDGFDIKVEGDDLIISGYSSRGTLYGVYTFLEEYIGWRWLDYDYEIVKVNDFIQIPLDTNDRQVPKIWLRTTDWYGVSGDFANKLKISTSGAIYAGGYASHTFTYLIPIEEYWDEHPEYFSWNGWVRDEAGNPKDWQPCLTNPEVYEIVLAAVRKLLEQNPNAKIISVTQNDNTGSYCVCENCQKSDIEEGSPAGTMLRFVNAIARDVAEDYPNVLVDTFAYTYTRTPPLITKPEENVQIRLCSIECCFKHALDDPDCKVNRRFMDDFEKWAEMSNHVAIWDYTTNFDNYCALFPNIDILDNNVRLFSSFGVDNVFEEGNPSSVSGEFGALRSYMFGKLLWDPDMTEEEYSAHINDFLECYYGPGWQTVRKLLDDLTVKALDQPGHVHTIGKGDYYPYNGFELDDIEKIKTDWAAARELATDDAQRLHLDRSYISVLMAEVAYYYYNMTIDRTYVPKYNDLLVYVGALATELGISPKIGQSQW